MALKLMKIFPVAFLLYRQSSAMAQNKTGLQLQKFAWYKPDWALPTLSKESKDLLYQSKDTPTIKIQDDLNEVIKKSKAFPVDFPINTVRLEELKARRPIEKLKKNIVTTYPVVHERVVMLMAKFLAYKREHGSEIEKALYKDMSVAELIDRILKKRAVVFMGAYDNYKLLYGQQGADGWEAVGTPSEKAPLLLANCLSYDEMKLSSMVYVSGHTACINDGDRYNRGVVNETDVELDAVIIGIVGPRFERKHRMEYEDILITEQQNKIANGYGVSDAARQKWRQMWADFYQVDSPTYESLPSPIPDKPSEQQRYTDRFVNISKSGIVFDNEVYYKRLSVTADSVLLEAQARGIEEGRDTFVNVIGAGLGVWQVSPHQTDVYILTFLERTRVLMEIGAISRVADVNFAYVRPSMGILELFTCTNGPDGTPASAKKLFLENKNHPRGGINVQLERREPSSKLTGEHDGKLLVMTYPWDGNAHPGNEFWIGSLDGSGDPAAAASTQVSELHNAHINNAVCGTNARIVGQKGVHKLMEWLAPQRG